MQTTITTFDNSAEGWERALYAFLAEKERRSGSRRTVEGYSRMLQHCFGTIGKPPDKLTSQEVFAWAYGTGLSGKQPSSVTIGARLACLSSFFHFLIRMEAVTSNPCDALERPKVSVAPPRGLGGTDIQKLLAVIPQTPTGLRDRAIVLTLTLSGRRRAEVLNMKVGDITHEDGKTWYRYRGKGGKTGKRELPEPAFVALTLALSAFGHDIAGMAPDASLWPARRGDTRGITSGSFYGNLQRYFRLAGLPPAGVHIFRHSAAKLRRDAGESIEDVSRFLDHSSLAVTSVYLRRLEGEEDRSWARVAAALGVLWAPVVCPREVRDFDPMIDLIYRSCLSDPNFRWLGHRHRPSVVGSCFWTFGISFESLRSPAEESCIETTKCRPFGSQRTAEARP